MRLSLKAILPGLFGLIALIAVAAIYFLAQGGMG